MSVRGDCTMSGKCFRPNCGKTVYHAEKQEHDGKIFHSRCLNLWKKEVEEQERLNKNALNYEKTADVSPSYYRVGNVSNGSGPTMMSGQEEREKGLAPKSKGNTQPSGGGGGGDSGPKFCPECGVSNAGGKFCGECGHKW